MATYQILHSHRLPRVKWVLKAWNKLLAKKVRKLTPIKKKNLVGVYLAKDGVSEIRLPLKNRPNCVLLAIEKAKS